MYVVYNKDEVIGLFFKLKDAKKVLVDNPYFTIEKKYGVAWDFFSLEDLKKAFE